MWRLLLFHLFLVSAVPLIFQTGPPELSPSAGAITFPMPEPEYRKLAGSGMSILIPIRKLPAGASAHALYGYNFVVGGKNRGWILDGDAEQGWTLYLDMDGTGDLTTAPPLRFEKVDGVYRLVKEVTDGDARWPVRFEITHFKVAGEEKLAVAIQASTVRKGVIEIGGARFPFKLLGDNARYNRPTDRVAFDRKGNGEFESYKISDHYVNLAGKTYGFTVDDAGNALMLVESATPLPDRPSLKPGAPAPAFAATDIDQNTHRLEDYRGRMLLLEFWSTQCGPCREEALGHGRILEVRGRIKRRRAEVVDRLRVCACAQKQIDHRLVVVRGSPDQRGPALRGDDVLLRPAAQYRLDVRLAPLLYGRYQRLIAGVCSQRRARNERHAQHTRQKRCFDVHRRSPAEAV